MTYRILILLTAILLFSGCSDSRKDKRLIHIADLVSESPKAVLACLDNINYNNLSDADRHYYDFLKIKATDKAYIKHTSDSTILRVIDYYSNHDKDNLYAETLYYGARTYGDMGDSPTALQYFYKALDNIGEETSNLDLKANILSQTGRLLTELRLYEDAIPYIEKAIEIGEYYKDTLNMVYDIQLLGGTYLRDKKYVLAEHYFNKAIELSSNLPMSFNAKSRMYLAEIKYETGQSDSALSLIRGTPDSVTSNARNSALAAASEIYLEQELLDSAYMYACKLLNSQDPTNKGTSYQILLSPKLRNYIPLDTIYQYISDYRGLLETYHDSNKAQLSINQQSFYNYQRHVIERHKIEAHNLILTWWIYGISTVCLILAVIILYYKNKTKKTLIELHVAIENASILNDRLNTISLNQAIIDSNSNNTNNNQQEDTQYNDIFKASLLTLKAEKELREKLRKELLDLYSKNTTAKISNIIYESKAYGKLQELIKQKQILSYEDPLWDELECVVLKSSPKFKDNLQLLTQSRLTSIDLHTALLVKCHIQPSQMSTLLSRSKGAIVSRRESLCLKIFGEQLGTKVIDGIIRLL